MFGGLGKNFWGLQVCFLMDWKVANKKMCQVSLFHPTNQSSGVVLLKDVFKGFANFTGKHKCQRLFINKVAVLRSETLFKKRLCTSVFL